MQAVFEHLNPLLLLAVLTGLLSIYYLFSSFSKIKKLKLFSAASRLFSFLMFAFITLSISLLVVGTLGYQGITKEHAVANIKITPTGAQSFQARLIFGDGSQQIFSLKGDELVVDAYILKWKNWTNILGLHTAYRLERIGGRYKNINDEKMKSRTVFAINERAGKGIAQWRENYSMLSFLLDVEHGSASFVDANKIAESQLMVTTSGLLIRPVKQ